MPSKKEATVHPDSTSGITDNTVTATPFPFPPGPTTGLDLTGLSNPFHPDDDIEWLLVSTNIRKDKNDVVAQAKPYIRVESGEDRLDEIVGAGNWENEIKVEPGRLTYVIRINISGDPHNPVWRERSDGVGYKDGEDDNYEKAITAAAKRAMRKWGIGRYLRKVTAAWVDVSMSRKNGYEYARAAEKDNQGKRTGWKTFYWKAPLLPESMWPAGYEAPKGGSARPAPSQEPDSTPLPPDEPKEYITSEIVDEFRAYVAANILSPDDQKTLLGWLIADKKTKAINMIPLAEAEQSLDGLRAAYKHKLPRDVAKELYGT